MIMKLRNAMITVVFLQLGVCGTALAGDGYIGPVYIDQVGTVALPVAGHIAGNFEIKVGGSFTPPAGVSCDGTYITTLKTVDADKRMLMMASLAQATKQPVYLFITDDPSYRAFGGRCSLLGITLGP
jgi:hypothetical protein